MCFYIIDLLIIEEHYLENLEEPGQSFPGSCSILDHKVEILNLCVSEICA